MTDTNKYETIVETIKQLEDLLDCEDVELQSVWDTWVTRLAGEHALYYVNDLLEVMKRVRNGVLKVLRFCNILKY